jgi:hypothetical protein
MLTTLHPHYKKIQVQKFMGYRVVNFIITALFFFFFLLLLL